MSRAERKRNNQIIRELQEKLIAEMREQEAKMNKPKYTGVSSLDTKAVLYPANLQVWEP